MTDAQYMYLVLDTVYKRLD